MGEILQWLSVVGLATVKVLAGLGVGIAYGMKPWQIFVCLAAGSMIGVVFFTFFGQRIRVWRKERRKQRYILELEEIGKARKVIARRVLFWQSKPAMLIPGFLRRMFGSINGSYRLWLRKRRRKSRKPAALNFRKARKWKKMWLRYGLPGIALLTPPLISPPIGALIAAFFERRRGRILAYMGVSILLWSALFAAVGHQILALIH
jgi:hypothetical protein